MKKIKRIKIKLGGYILIIIVILSAFTFKSIKNGHTKAKHTEVIQIDVQEEKPFKMEINDVLDGNDEIQENKIEEPQEEIYEEPSNTYITRMTSFYPEEGEAMTASGLGINDFQVNENGWFTYNDKIVVATASTRLGYTDMRTYNLYDELIINIEGIDYEAIVLDVCGACQRDNRIDLFASSVIYAKDTMVEVKIK